MKEIKEQIKQALKEVRLMSEGRLPKKTAREFLKERRGHSEK
ncbi:hypothetical protein [Bacillus sp. AG4(2022)]|nr:hypothetical protein [Bacillus sp. AG4(2022)]MDT0160362.1 hypothetical protein [Bacillus sp. AG4(2022)]